MAEIIGLGASIIGIAGAGISTVTALAKFGISYRGSDKKIDELAARVSLTATVLYSTGEIIEEHKRSFKRKEFLSTWSEVLKSCEESYRKLNTAIAKAKGTKNDVAKGSKTPQLSTWFKLKWALGGEDEMKDLEVSLEKACQQVMMMQQVVQLTAISVVARRQEPTKKEVDERKELMDKMDWILNGLSKSGILITGYTNSYANVSKVSGMNPEIMEKEVKVLATTSEDDSLPTNITLLASKGATISSGVMKEQDNGAYEAYYVVPRSLSRNSPKGSLHVIREGTGDYMAVVIDPRSFEPNYRHAIARAPAKGTSYDPRQQRAQIATKFSKVPDPAAKEIMWLIGDRLSDAKDNRCDWIEIQELSWTQAAAALLSVAASAYLVVMRCKLDKPLVSTPMSSSGAFTTLTLSAEERLKQNRFASSLTHYAPALVEHPKTEISMTLEKRASELAEIREDYVRKDLALIRQSEKVKRERDREEDELEVVRSLHLQEVDRRLMEQNSGAEPGLNQDESDNSAYNHRVGLLEYQIMEEKSRLRHIEDDRAQMRERLDQSIQEREVEVNRVNKDWVRVQRPALSQEALLKAPPVPYSLQSQGGDKSEATKVEGVNKRPSLRHFFRMERTLEPQSADPERKHSVRNFFRKGRKDDEFIMSDISDSALTSSAMFRSAPLDESENEKRINDFMASFSTLYERDP